jgi:hypothetical protein
MSYGLQIESDSGKLLILDENLVPWFLGKGTPGAPSAWVAQIGSSHDKLVMNYTIPSGSSLVAMTLPTVSDSQPIWIERTGSGVRAWRLTGGGASWVAPELYCFSFGRPVMSTSGYGMQIRDSLGRGCIDTLSAPPIAFHSLLLKAPEGANVSLGLLPTKPAFILLAAGKETNVTIPSTTTRQVRKYRIGFRRTGSGMLETGYFQDSEFIEDAGGTFIDYYGSQAAQAVPTINAANYD